MAVSRDSRLTVSFFRSRADAAPKEKRVAWTDFCALMAEDQLRVSPGLRKDARGGFTMCTFKNGHRGKADVDRCYGIALDLEADEETGEIMPPSLEVLGRIHALGLQALVYSTYSHTPERPRYRALLPADGPADAGTTSRAARAVLERLGLPFDKASLHPEQMMFMPTVPSEEAREDYELEIIDGPRVSLDEWAALAPREEPAASAPAQDPFDVFLERCEEQGRGVVHRGPDDAMVQCPTHNDRNPSLHVQRSSMATVVMHCFAPACAGLTAPQFFEAVGLRWSEVVHGETAAKDFGEEQEADELGGAAVTGSYDWTHRFIDGGSFIFDVPDEVPALWGERGDVIWPEGEALMVCGPSGVGKTTLIGQVVRAMLFGGDVLGHAVRVLAPGEKILYLAMDRPSQIQRSLKRQFHGYDRARVEQSLLVWKGPPPEDLAQSPEKLLAMCRWAGAGTVIVDSLKDAAIGLSEDAVAAGWNRARQMAIAEGVQVCELHHQVKRGPNGAAPTTLADVYGSTWLTGGAGSVILLYGKAGDPIVRLLHLKQSQNDVGPLDIFHDQDSGEISVWSGEIDPLALARNAGRDGITKRRLAEIMFARDRPTDAEIAKAGRRLHQCVRRGELVIRDGSAEATLGTQSKVYVLPEYLDFADDEGGTET
ncbi:AAA family ATPase [Sinomonas sp. P10A9]|uniref:AAA family ATPase n=1 Tax=Sinomonas puerhi TaxID=3238584 RepID=A0AB39L040_9MICC